MGATYSKKTTDESQQTVSGASTERDNVGALAATESSWHYKRHNNNVSLSHQKRASRLHRDYEEQEEKLSESFSESDLNQMMMKSVAMDRRHHASRAAVHPIANEHPSHTLPIESLPPPVYEVKRNKRERGSSSLPVRCPSRSRPTDGALKPSLSEDDGDSEYLSKLYDLRTWNMYRLITETRRKRQIEYQPSIIGEEKTVEVEDEDYYHPVEEEESSFTTTMIFAFDYE